MTFDQALAHHRAAYHAGAHFAREAIATGRARIRGPVGLSAAGRLAYWLAAAHALRDCVIMPTKSPAHRAHLRAAQQKRRRHERHRLPQSHRVAA